MSKTAQGNLAIALSLWDQLFHDPYSSDEIVRKQEERRAAAEKARAELERSLVQICVPEGR